MLKRAPNSTISHIWKVHTFLIVLILCPFFIELSVTGASGCITVYFLYHCYKLTVDWSGCFSEGFVIDVNTFSHSGLVTYSPALTLWRVSSTPLLVSSFWSMKTKNKKKVNQPIQYEQVYGHSIKGKFHGLN